MAALLHLVCDASLCEAEVTTTCRSVALGDARLEAQLEGWQHLEDDNGTVWDFCPDHRQEDDRG